MGTAISFSREQLDTPRFWAKVNKVAGGCWLWTAATGWNGYGIFQAMLHRRVYVRAHRASWIIHRGPIPEGICVLHKCDVCNCVNPDHLFLGTARDNTTDMINKGRKAQFSGRPGEANPLSKLRSDDVRRIRTLYVTGDGTAEHLASLFGIHVEHVRKIIRRKAWSHVS